MNTDDICKGRLLGGEELQKEYRMRRKDCVVKSIPITEEIPKGWDEPKPFKTTRRITRPKSTSEQFEDDVWCLLHSIGMTHMCTRGFSITLRRRGNIVKTKQLDVVADDGEVVFVVECKTRHETGRSAGLKKDVAEFASVRSDVIKSLKRVFSGERQFAFVLATKNIRWTDNDRIDAEDSSIFIWDERDIQKLGQLAEVAGQGARYQIYNRIFYDRPVQGFRIKVPAIEAKMGGQRYYTFALSPAHLLKIAFVHQRGGECSFLELSDSYQRMINNTRIKRIREYIDQGGYFPGNIILNFTRKLQKELLPHRKSEAIARPLSGRPVNIILPRFYGAAWIIDGQHRLYGYADTPRRESETIPVVAFEDLEPSKQVRIFMDINTNQRSIDSDLKWDLYEDLYANSRIESEGLLYVISRIAKKLNEREPFKDRINIPKGEPRKDPEKINLETICKEIKRANFVTDSRSPFWKPDPEARVSYAVERISTYFKLFASVLGDESAARASAFVFSNPGVVILLGILRDIVRTIHEDIEPLDSYRYQMEGFMAPVIRFLQEADELRINRLSGASVARKQTTEVQVELIDMIRRERPYNSQLLERHERERKQEKPRLAAEEFGAQRYLEMEESQTFEVKGSIKTDLGRLLLGDGKSDTTSKKKELLDEVLQTIVGFVNAEGGSILIGAVEKQRFDNMNEERRSELAESGDHHVVGIELDYERGGWDQYQLALRNAIETRISDDLTADVIRIQKLPYKELELCLITVESVTDPYFLDKGHFYVRDGNQTRQLKGRAMHDYLKRARR